MSTFSHAITITWVQTTGLKIEWLFLLLHLKPMQIGDAYHRDFMAKSYAMRTSFCNLMRTLQRQVFWRHQVTSPLYFCELNLSSSPAIYVDDWKERRGLVNFSVSLQCRAPSSFFLLTSLKILKIVCPVSLQLRLRVCLCGHVFWVPFNALINSVYENST